MQTVWMGRIQAAVQLERHYSYIKGELQALAGEITAAGAAGAALAAYRELDAVSRRAMLVHIEACMALFEPEWSPEQVEPRHRRRARRGLDRGKLLSMAYDVLREAPRPISSSEIVEALGRADRLTRAQTRDPALRSALTTLFRDQEAKRAVRSHGLRPLRWSVVRSSRPECAGAGAHPPPPIAANTPSSASTRVRV